MIQSNKILNKRGFEDEIEEADKKIPNNSKFIMTQGFNRLTQINFNMKIAEESKNLTNENK